MVKSCQKSRNSDYEKMPYTKTYSKANGPLDKYTVIFWLTGPGLIEDITPSLSDPSCDNI